MSKLAIIYLFLGSNNLLPYHQLLTATFVLVFIDFNSTFTTTYSGENPPIATRSIIVAKIKKLTTSKGFNEVLRIETLTELKFDSFVGMSVVTASTTTAFSTTH